MTSNLSPIKVTCPHCAFSREVPAEKVPEKQVTVSCPKCGNKFPFGRPAAAAPPAAGLEPARGVLPSGPAKPAASSASPAVGSAPAPGDLTAGPQVKPAPILPATPRPVRPTPPHPVPAEQKPASLGLVILPLLALCAAGWWLNFPSAEPVVDGSYSDEKHKFAVKAPAEWILVTPENYRSILEQHRDRIPKEIAGLISKQTPGFAVSFMRIPASETEFVPSFNVVIADTQGRNLPRLTESEKDKAAEAISGEMSRQIRGYRMKKAKIVEIDGLDSLQMDGEAELTVVTKPAQPIYSQPGAFGWRRVTGHTQAEQQIYRLQTLQTLIPGRKRGYAVSFMYDDLKTPDMLSVQREVMKSFRVLERPPRFSGILMSALNGGLVGAGLYLLRYLLGRVFKTEEG